MPEALMISPPTGQARILVVDDTEANRYVVARHLLRNGYTVDEAANGHDALEMAVTTSPDLIVLDIRLPDINGFEIARRLREDERTTSIPILHLSASFTDAASMARGLDNGADGYLTHPVDPPVILATVRALLRARTAEHRVREVADEWRATFDSIGEGVCITDSGGIVVRSNQAFCELLDITVNPGDRLDELVPELAPLATETSPEALRLDIGDRNLRVSVVPAQVGAGHRQSRVYVVTDLTRERIADERVRRMLQLETTGRLAGGVAHEINNMMTAILSYAEFALRGFDADDTRRADILGIHKAATRSAEIARQLLTYSRRQIVHPRHIDALQLIREITPSLKRLLGAHHSLTLELLNEPAWVKIDPLGFEQILINLVLNARDAMESGGRVLIRAAVVELDERFVALHPEIAIRTGAYLQIDVIDNGHGMSPGVLEKIFDPFFTTKEVGKGTGLGLAVVFGMVKQSEGYIWASSEVGQGSRFSIQLPLVAAVADVPDEQVRETDSSGRLLVVEDEPVVLELLSRGLREAGYHVEEAADGIKAMEVLERLEGKVDGVVTDVIMPLMNGKELAQQIRGRWPGMPILFVSGYTTDEVVGRGLLARGEEFLQKPFAPGVLVSAVGRVLKGVRVT
jgi:DNA-binding response OmpR family regulator